MICLFLVKESPAAIVVVGFFYNESIISQPYLLHKRICN